MNRTLRERAASAYRWQIAVGFCAVLSFTVIAGYHVPLRREAAALRAEKSAALGASAAADAELGRLREELEHARADAERLRSAAASPRAAAARIEQRIDELTRVLSTRFGRLVQAGMLVISSADDRMSVALAVPALFDPGQLRVTANGRSLLCQLSQTILAQHRGQVRVSGYHGRAQIEERSVAARHPTPWHLSSARAASAAEVLTGTCGLPADRFLVVGYGPRAAGPLGENVALELIVGPED